MPPCFQRNEPMKKTIFLMILLTLGSFAYAQDIEFTAQDTIVTGAVGEELVFVFHLKNISQTPQTAFLVRTMNQLPTDWQSSLCFESCFAPFIDSVATNADFFSSPLQPGEEREVSLHVFTLNNAGTANLRIEAATMRSPDSRIGHSLTATASIVSVDDEALIRDFTLQQNYPNPFNPSTRINFALAQQSPVTITVSDITGREVAKVVDGVYQAGEHAVVFDAAQLSGGVYFYTLQSSQGRITKQMLLLK